MSGTEPAKAEPNGGLTRRTVLLGAGGLAVLGGIGLWGRFAFGAAFEHHVSAQLGLGLELTEGVLARMRSELGDYEVRAAGFLLATKGPADELIPGALRREAIDAFVGPMFGLSRGLVMPLDYAGLRDSPDYRPCAVLVR